VRFELEGTDRQALIDAGATPLDLGLADPEGTSSAAAARPQGAPLTVRPPAPKP